MKKLFMFFTILSAIFAVIMFSSCQKEDDIIPGIIYTDNPPEELLVVGSLPIPNKCWVEALDFYECKSLGYSFQQYNDGEKWIIYNDGDWYTIKAYGYWGIKNGVIYMTSHKETYVLPPDSFKEGLFVAKEKGQIIGHVCYQCNNPFNGALISGWSD